MKKTLLLLIAIAFSAITYSQSVITEKTKYKVKRISTNKGYEAIVPLVWGDKKTNENVTVVYAIDSLSKFTADTIYKIQTLYTLNAQSKYQCKNPYSWRPSTITIMHDKEKNTISVIVKGSAENAYGSRGDVTFFYNRENGEYVPL
jgi:hypothetical protein